MVGSPPRASSDNYCGDTEHDRLAVNVRARDQHLKQQRVAGPQQGRPQLAGRGIPCHAV